MEKGNAALGVASALEDHYGYDEVVARRVAIRAAVEDGSEDGDDYDGRHEEEMDYDVHTAAWARGSQRGHEHGSSSNIHSHPYAHAHATRWEARAQRLDSPAQIPPDDEFDNTHERRAWGAGTDAQALESGSRWRFSQPVRLVTSLAALVPKTTARLTNNIVRLPGDFLNGENEGDRNRIFASSGEGEMNELDRDQYQHTTTASRSGIREQVVFEPGKPFPKVSL